MQDLRSNRKVDSVPQPFIEGLNEETNSHAIILSEVNYRTTRSRSASLQIGDGGGAGANEVVRCDRKHVVPRSRRSPHLAVLQ